MIFNVPNLLTISRILAIPLVVWGMYLDPPHWNWWAFGIYTYACITDFFDGYLARALKQQSALGRMLDPIADKLLVSCILMMVIATGAISGIHVIAALIILFREITVSGLREFMADANVSMPVTTLAKWKTTVQLLALGFLVVGTAGPMFPFDLTTIDIGLIGLWIAALVTVITGFDYFMVALRHVKKIDSGTKVGK